MRVFEQKLVKIIPKNTFLFSLIKKFQYKEIIYIFR